MWSPSKTYPVDENEFLFVPPTKHNHTKSGWSSSSLCFSTEPLSFVGLFVFVLVSGLCFLLVLVVWALDMAKAKKVDGIAKGKFSAFFLGLFSRSSRSFFSCRSMCSYVLCSPASCLDERCLPSSSQKWTSCSKRSFRGLKGNYRLCSSPQCQNNRGKHCTFQFLGCYGKYPSLPIPVDRYPRLCSSVRKVSTRASPGCP